MSNDLREIAHRLAQHGCPVETDRGGNGGCAFCGGPNYGGIYGEPGMIRDGVLRHRPDCPWPPFEAIANA